MNKKYFYILWFISFFGFSQTEELQYLKGKVVCDIEDLKSISITNKRSQSIVNPEANGNFSMFVKIGDELLFDGMTIKTKQITLSEDDLKKNFLQLLFPQKLFLLKMLR